MRGRWFHRRQYAFTNLTQYFNGNMCRHFQSAASIYARRESHGSSRKKRILFIERRYHNSDTPRNNGGGGTGGDGERLSGSHGSLSAGVHWSVRHRGSTVHWRPGSKKFLEVVLDAVAQVGGRHDPQWGWQHSLQQAECGTRQSWFWDEMWTWKHVTHF